MRLSDRALLVSDRAFPIAQSLLSIWIRRVDTVQNATAQKFHNAESHNPEKPQCRKMGNVTIVS